MSFRGRFAFFGRVPREQLEQPSQPAFALFLFFARWRSGEVHQLTHGRQLGLRLQRLGDDGFFDRLFMNRRLVARHIGLRLKFLAAQAPHAVVRGFKLRRGDDQHGAAGPRLDDIDLAAFLVQQEGRGLDR